jgi:hypothetical protein
MSKKLQGPNAAEQVGCFLLVGSSMATAILGLMAIGAFLPNFAVIAFQAAVVALVASIFLVSALGGLSFLRGEDRDR